MVQPIIITQNMNVTNKILRVFSNGHRKAEDYVSFDLFDFSSAQTKTNFFERGGKTQRYTQIREIV